MHSDETRDKISRSQRKRYESERKAEWERRNELVAFALWLHPSWEDTNEDDVASATRAVDAFLALNADGEATAEGEGT